jgi:ankyrin repeat protein
VQGGLTALMEAVMRNHSTFAEILVQAGADLNLQDNVRVVNVVVYGRPASVYSSLT